MGKNRNKSKKQVMNDEPEGMLSGLSSTRTSSAVSSKKRVASPTLYDEDIGDIATKKIKPSTFLGNNNIGKLKVTKDEKRRRQEREVSV
jgi:hypothetical protein